MLSLDDFTRMLSDKSLYDSNKMLHKYGREELRSFIEALHKSLYKELPLRDFDGKQAVLLPCKINLTSQLKQGLLKTYYSEKYGFMAMENEIISTLAIERIDSTNESVRRILAGGAPTNESEKKAYGIKKGLDYISDVSNHITEENLRTLYMMIVGEYLKPEEYIPQSYNYMSDLIGYINSDDDLDQVIKSIVIHYYIAYLHPYFDGNGRMARLIQMWYLMQKGYSQAMFIPFSAFINESKGEYYKAFSRIAKNRKVAGILDITPFVLYFIDNVFAKLGQKIVAIDVLNSLEALLLKGVVTVKEKELINFVLSTYGYKEFSTKQLEKDFGNAAYATIRGFVLKFEEFGILEKAHYGARVKYKVK